MRQAAPAERDLVLIGGGHSHLFVLKALGMEPVPGLRVTLIAREVRAPYSGMLPGFVAGHYSLDDVHIDLLRLATFAGARLVHGSATGIDRQARRVLLADRPPVAYDLLSIDVGITPSIAGIDGGAEHGFAVKPISTFAPRWLALLEDALRPDGPRRFAVVGAGAAGFELVLAMRERLRSLAPGRGIDPDAFGFTLIGAGPLLPTHNRIARALARAALARAGVTLHEDVAATAVDAGAVTLADGRRIAADAALLCTGAAPPAWFAGSDLPRDGRGYLAVRPTLQLLDDDDVFAAGDCAGVAGQPREKSGVFAVRQGPPLADNIRRRALGRAARPFRMQRQFLTLLSTGGRHAIAARGPLAVAGDWAWRWKDRIDRRFMDRFGDLPAMAAAEDEMRCAGCAAKVGPVTLARTLDRLDPGGPRDDAAVIDGGGDALTLETVDFFRAFWPDPYLFGEIAAAHAMSDVFAMGGTVERALATVVLPHALPRQVEEDLFQLLSGARAALERDGARLLGGHSGEGPEMAAGLTVTGSVPRADLRRKGGLRPGDRLVLTRPLGTGILFAAAMRGAAVAEPVFRALERMRRSNREAAAILAAHGASAMTDVTGFGLGGHLLEMLEASGVDATVEAAALPLYPEVARLAAEGVASTLLPENLAAAGRVDWRGSPAWLPAVLFDPQTSGGLLAGIPESAVEACVAALRAGPAPEAAAVGAVQARAGDAPALRIEAPSRL